MSPQPLTLGIALLLLSTPAPATLPSRDDPFPPATPESQGVSSTALAELVDQINIYIERDQIVGAELLLIKNRRTILHESFGYSDRDDNIPWTDGTICNIRSMTKPLTGAAIQVLADRNKLSLDDPVAKYLPGFDTNAAREITLRQLLTHRSGLPLTLLTTIDEYETLLDMGNALGAKGPEFEPNTRFWYSDAATDALGAIVEIASGKKIDIFVHQELLAPLRMTDSFYYLDGEDPRRDRIASLYYGGAKNWKRFLDPSEGTFYPFAWGSQSLYSTPMDYARFLAMWMDRGRVGDRTVLSEKAVDRTLTPVVEMSMLGSEARFPTSYSGLEVYYGQMAVLHIPREAHGQGPATIIGHSGSDGTIAWAWPERDLIILFFTQSRGGGAVLRLESAIDRLLISPEAYADQADVPAELQEYLGTYISDWATHMKEEFIVQCRGDQLLLDIPTQMIYELVPTDEPEKWAFAISSAVTVWFDRSRTGEVDCLRIQQGALVFEAPRKGTPHEREVTEANRPDPELVGKYLGTYHDPEEDDDFEVFIDGDYLAARIPGGDVLHLWKVPMVDAWQVRENPVFTVTFQEQGGVVLSLTRAGPGEIQVVMPRK